MPFDQDCRGVDVDIVIVLEKIIFRAFNIYFYQIIWRRERAKNFARRNGSNPSDFAHTAHAQVSRRSHTPAQCKIALSRLARNQSPKQHTLRFKPIKLKGLQRLFSHARVSVKQKRVPIFLTINRALPREIKCEKASMAPEIDPPLWERDFVQQRSVLIGSEYFAKRMQRVEFCNGTSEAVGKRDLEVDFGKPMIFQLERNATANEANLQRQG